MHDPGIVLYIHVHVVCDFCINWKSKIDTTAGHSLTFHPTRKLIKAFSKGPLSLSKFSLTKFLMKL